MQLEIYAYLYNDIVTMKYRITNSNRHAADTLEDLLMNLERRAAYTDNVIHKRGLIKKETMGFYRSQVSSANDNAKRTRL